MSLDAGSGPDPGSTEVTAGTETLTFRSSPDPFVALHMPTFDLRIDGFNGAPSSPTP